MGKLSPRIPREHNKYHGYTVRGTPHCPLIDWKPLGSSILANKNSQRGKTTPPALRVLPIWDGCGARCNPVAIFGSVVGMMVMWAMYPTSHNHGSVKNGCISNRIVTFSTTAMFHWTMIMGERVSSWVCYKLLYTLNICFFLPWWEVRSLGTNLDTWQKEFSIPQSSWKYLKVIQHKFHITSIPLLSNWCFLEIPRNESPQKKKTHFGALHFLSNTKRKQPSFCCG